MNKTYRLVWSALKNVWVATAETVRGRGKQGPSRVALALAGLLGLTGAAAQAAGPAPAATALPTGGQVVAGQATVTQGAATMAITQGSNRAAIDWASFNVGSQAQVNIQQPSANAVLLNRVTGNDASQIFGRINANGQVFLSNPNGVYFAPGASVDVGGLVATTHRIGLDEFMAGTVRFERNGATGSVINEGELKAALGGYIALLAPEVRNQGVIVAQLGTVALAAGEAFELQFDGNRTLAGLRVDAATIRTLVDNRSAVLAPGGLVILSAQAMNSVQGGVVRSSGTVEATGLVARNGRIVLDASHQVVVDGGVVSTAAADGRGGDITLTGDSVALQGGARLDASGAQGGGQVRVGGGWQGGEGLRQASSVTMAEGSTIDASATRQGDGGSVVLWSDLHRADGQTTANGRIVARGAGAGGRGGQIETSGHAVDTGTVQVDAGADAGTGGLWLIDPYSYFIGSTQAATIASTLSSGTSVTVSTAVNNITQGSTGNSGNMGNITLTGAIAKTGDSDATLTLKAHRDIFLTNASVTATGSGALNLVLWTRAVDAGDDGQVSINGSTIHTNGGHLWVGGSDTHGGSTTWNGLTVGDGTTDSWSIASTGTYLKSTSISTGAGSIALRGESYYSAGSSSSSPATGVWLDVGTTLATTTGNIDIKGTIKGGSTSSAGTWIGAIGTTPGDVVISTQSGALNITGANNGGAGTWGHGLVVASSNNGDKTVIKTDSGALTLVGSTDITGAVPSSSSGLQIQVGATGTTTAQVVSRTGNITIRGSSADESSAYPQVNGLRLDAADASNSIRIGDDGITPYSGNILIQSNSIREHANTTSAGSIFVGGSGSLTIEPLGSSFTYLRSASGNPFDNGWNFGTTLSHFTLGKVGNTGDVALNTALSIAGGIDILGGRVTVNAPLTSTSTGDINVIASAATNEALSVTGTINKTGGGDSTLTARSNGRVSLGGAVTNTSTDGVLNAVLWSDYGNTSGFGVSTVPAVTTRGGHLWVGGSSTVNGSVSWNGLTVGDGAAVGGSIANSNRNAIDLNGPINTSNGANGGDVYLWGGTTDSGYNSLKGGAGFTGINSGSGNITLRGNYIGMPAGLAIATTGAFTLWSGSGTITSDTGSLGEATDFNEFQFTTTPRTFTWGGANNTQAVTFSATYNPTLSVAERISVYGGDIALNGNLTSTATGSSIQVKAKGNITTASTRSFQTNMGNLVLWSDSDANGTGAILIGDSNTLNSTNGLTASGLSGGGAIVLAGGSDTNNDDLPDGRAASGTLSGIRLGGTQASYTKIYTGGGDLTLRGKSTSANTESAANRAGLFQYGQWLADVGKGGLSIDATSATHYAINFVQTTNNSTTTAKHLELISDKASGTAISITGSSAASHGVVFNYLNPKEILATGGGDIRITGTGAGSADGIFLQNVDILASSGNVTLDGGVRGLHFTNYGARLGSHAGTAVPSASGHVTLSGDRLQVDGLAAGFTDHISTSGTVTVQPSSDNFSNTLSWPITGLTLSSDVSGLTLGKNLGSNAHTDAIVVNGATTIAGPISIYAGSINLSANVTSTAAGAGILAKASGNLVVDPGASLQTNNGNLTLWADADGNGGFIGVRENTRFNTAGGSTTQTTGGGAITLAGGTTTDANGLPTGYAFAPNGTVAWGTAVPGGVQLGAYGSSAQSNDIRFYSGGGNIALRGKAADGAPGIAWYGGATGATQIVDAGAGTITLDGLGSTTGHGIELSYTGGPASPTLHSSSNATTAINITGVSTTTGTHAGYQGTVNLVASGTGGISVNGTTSAGSTTGGVVAGSLNMAAASGAIRVTSIGGTGLNIGGNWGKGSLAASSSNITLTADQMPLVTTSVDTSGTLTLQPYGNNFSSTLSWPIANVTLASSVSGLTLGKDLGSAGHTDTITVTSATSIAGPINLYAGSINLNADLTSTAAGARILAKASGNIVVADGKALQSNGGDITLWAESDAAGGGYIQLVNNNRLDSRTAAARTANVEASGLASASGGGNITLGGGNGATAADGYALSAGTAGLGGVNLGDQGHTSSVTTLYSGGGDVVVRGKQTGSSAMGVQWINGGDLNAGTGTVRIDGLNTGGGHGIELGAFRQNADVRIRASGGDAGTPAIDIHGTGFDTGGRGVLGQGVRLNSLGAGGINIVGVGGAGASNGIQGNNTLDVLAASGPITLDGGTQGITTVGSIGSLGSAPVPSTSNITLTGDRITFGGNGAALRTTGTVTLQPASQSFSGALDWLPTNLNALAPTVSGLTLGKAGNTADITIGSATTIGGPVRLYGGNLAINAALTATNSTVSLHASGNVSEGGSGSITADALLLNGGNVTLNAAANAVHTLAATGVGALSYTNSSALTLGTVGSTSGVNATGAVTIGTHIGDLTVAASLATTDTTASALTLNAGIDAAAGTVSGGNLVFNGSPTASVGSGGRAMLYSGSITGSSGLTALVGSGSGRFRYGSDEATQAYTLAPTSGLYAIYREQPTVSLLLGSATITYGDSLSAAFSLSGGSNGDTASQAFAVLPGTTVGGTLSTSGNPIVGTHSIAAAGGGSSASQLGYAGNTSGVSPGTLTVTSRTLNATLIGTDKVYDGSTAAALTASDNRVGNDVLNVVGTGTFADADVGTAKAITVTGTTLSGTDAANYTLSAGGSPTATITPKAVSISGLAADNKTYDGTTSAMVSNWGSVSTGVGSETLTLVGGSANFADANAGVGKTVTASGYTLADGSGRASNYTLASNSATTVADISKAVLTVTANDDAKFLVPQDPVNFADVRYSGFVNGENVSVVSGSATVSRSNPGDQTAGVYAGVLVPDISGLSAINYSFQPVNGTFHIVPSSQLLVRVTPVDGVYGSNTIYTLASASYYDGSAVQTVSLSNNALGNNRFKILDTNGGSASFTVKPSTSASTGAGLVPAGSYSLGPVDIDMANPQNFTGTVTVIGQEVVARRVLTASVANGVSKVYDGSAQMNGVQLTLGGLVNGDQVSTSGSGSFASPNAGTNLAYTVNGLMLNGADAANYVLQGGSSFGGNDGSITPKTLTVSASKVYDGTTALNAGSVTLGGFVGMQTLSYSGATASSAHVADSGKYVNALTLLDGSNGGLAANYQLPVLDAQNAPVTITPALLQASGTIGGALSKVYDGTAAATGAQVSGGVTGAVAGDTLSLSTSGLTLAYNSAHVVGASQIGATGSLGFAIDASSNGSQASDYSLTATPVAAVAAQITPALLQASGSIGGALSKVYDGSTSAAGAQVSGSVTGAVAGDSLSLLTNGVTLAYNSAHVVGASQIGATGSLGFAIDASSNGSQASDYSLTATPVAAVAAQMTPAPLQASATIGGTLSKVYDGSTSAAGAQVSGSVTGAVAGDNLSLLTSGLTLAYNATHVASATQIGASGTLGFSIDGSAVGSQASDYSFSATPVAAAAAQITPALLTLSASATGTSKVYDGSTAVGGSFAPMFGLLGLLAGDEATAGAAAAAYDSKNVGTASRITLSGITLGAVSGNLGSQASDYQLDRSSIDVAGSITPRALTVGLTGGSKVYDGHVQAPVGYSDDRVSGDMLTVSGSATFADKNVGSGKTVTATGLTLGGADVGNYVLATSSATTLADITRLDSVQWIGGNSGNWFDPANWAGGAVPDLSNVANVVIPAGVLVDFNPAGLVAPAEAGPVNIDSLGQDGGLSMGGGSLVVGNGGVTLQTLVQNDGTLSTTGGLNLGSLTQTGGSLSAQTGITVNGPYSQTGSGTVTTPGAVTIASSGNPGSTVVLGNLNAGTLNVNSQGGNITQTQGTSVVVSGDSTLNAGGGDLTVDSPSNQLGGAVNVTGNSVTVVDGDGSLVMGTISAGGTLQLSSPDGTVTRADGSAVPANRDAAAIATSQQAGAVAVAAQALPPTLSAQAAPISAPAPLLVVADASGAGAVGAAGAGGSAVAVSGAGAGAGAVTSQSLGTATGTASGTAPAAGSGAPTLSVTLERLPSTASEGSLRVLVPAALQASGFEFSLPLALTMALAPDQPVFATLRDGAPLPAWLQLDPATRSFRAQAVPAGALPLTVVISANGRRALMTLTSP